MLYQRDFQLRQDIHQLERALNNYDTKFDSSQAKHKLLKLKVSSVQQRAVSEMCVVRLGRTSRLQWAAMSWVRVQCEEWRALT